MTTSPPGALWKVAVESTFSLQDVVALAPVLLLVIGGCTLLLSEVFLQRPARSYQPVLSAAFAALAGVVAWGMADSPARDIFGGFARLDGFGSFIGVLVCFSIALTSLFAASHLRQFASERGEFHALLHFSGVGMILLAQVTDLVTLFVAIEVMSLGTYALTAYFRHSIRPSEAALKYFILGAFSSAVLLYGAALAYGAAGTTKLADIARAVAVGGGTQTLLVVSLALISAGFLFKVAAIPFHTWAPDVYEGAPTTVTGFMASGVKAAAFAAFVRVLYVAFGQDVIALGGDGGKGWYDMIVAVAVLTMVVGNVLALAQKSVKRMLAYSSIAHAGYLLVGVAVGAFGATRDTAIRGVLFYLAAYAAASLGSFAVCAALEKRGGREIDDDARYDGLAQRHPGMALAMTIFLLSLASVPPTAGFMGKFFVFSAALEAGAVGLTVIALLSSVISLYYYLRVVVLMYMKPATEELPELPRAGVFGAGLAIAAGVTLLFGLLPGQLTEFTQLAAALVP